MRRGGAARVGFTRRGSLSVQGPTEAVWRGRWCSGILVVEPARSGDMQGWRRIDRPPLGDDLCALRRQLRHASELQRYAGCAVGGVVRVVLVGAAALDVGWSALRRASLGRRCQKRGYTLGCQREEGGQDENTRTWTAKRAQDAGHQGKLVNGRSAVTGTARLRGGPMCSTHTAGKPFTSDRRDRERAMKTYAIP